MVLHAWNMDETAVRRPLTTIPEVPRISGGGFRESPGYRVLRPRGTDDFLLICTRSGVGRFRTEGRSLAAPTGSLTLLRPGTPHDYAVATGSDHWELDFAHFHPRPEWELLLDWPQPLPGVGWLVVSGEVATRLDQAFATVRQHQRSDLPRADLFAMNALEQVLLWADTQNPRSRPIDSRLVAVLEHLDRHLAEPLSIEELARVAHLSPSRFAHWFSEQLGQPPGRYLDGLRMAEAKVLLEFTRRPVAEIARQVGYLDPLHFSRRFRVLVGVSPSSFRQR